MLRKQLGYPSYTTPRRPSFEAMCRFFVDVRGCMAQLRASPPKGVCWRQLPARKKESVKYKKRGKDKVGTIHKETKETQGERERGT